MASGNQTGLAINMDRLRKKINKKGTFPLTIAVTGSAGSGKTTVCQRFKALGLVVINADKVAREVVAPGAGCLKKISDHFGADVINSTGELDRSALRERIINNEKERLALEAIVHPAITLAMNRSVAEAAAAGKRVVIVEVPLLFEAGMADQYDVVVLVSASRQNKVHRLMARDNVSFSSAESLLDIQMSDEEKKYATDIIIENTGTVGELIKKVDQLHELFYQETRVVGKSTGQR